MALRPVVTVPGLFRLLPSRATALAPVQSYSEPICVGIWAESWVLSFLVVCFVCVMISPLSFLAIQKCDPEASNSEGIWRIIEMRGLLFASVAELDYFLRAEHRRRVALQQ